MKNLVNILNSLEPSEVLEARNYVPDSLQKELVEMSKYIAECNEALSRIANIPTNHIFDSRTIAKVQLSRYF